jgi:hypothetical protein
MMAAGGMDAGGKDRPDGVDVVDRARVVEYNDRTCGGAKPRN